MACKNGCAAQPVLVAAKMQYFMLALTRLDLIYPNTRHIRNSVDLAWARKKIFRGSQ
jgi:hypothetical protein